MTPPPAPRDTADTGTMTVRQSDVVVVGSGSAGMAAALALAPRRVTLLTKTDDLPGGSSLWAQGGIAVALGADDSPAEHSADTLVAGAGLCDPAQVDLLTREGVARINDLLADGLGVDRTGDGQPLLGREAAHNRHRIVHAGGDATGRNLVQHLAARVRTAPHITVAAQRFAWDLLTRETGVGRRVCGVLAHGPQGWELHLAPHVLLATGGAGQLWAVTTNPAESTGDGVALAARAGARLADLEFMQFHPTALGVDTLDAASGGRRPLLTEALRGAGAWLLDQDGHRFMLDEHPDAELAPRDVVARAIGRRVAAGQAVRLDLGPLFRAHGADAMHHFPTVAGILRDAGLDPAQTPVPVAPAAHYHMGGVLTDADGRTSLPGLWAAGETACTYVHGANRLASNSLLEALVFARRAADAILAAPATPQPVPVPPLPTVRGSAALADLTADLRRLMSTHVGLLRDEAGLGIAATGIMELRHAADALPPLSGSDAAPDAAPDAVRAAGEMRNRLDVARLVVEAARRRTESRGAHSRADHPQPRDDWRHHQIMALGGHEAAQGHGPHHHADAQP